MEKTLVLIRPRVAENSTAVQNIEKILRKAGLSIVSSRMYQLNRADLEDFYPVDVGRSYWEEIVDLHLAGQSLVLVYEGDEAIDKGRMVLGDTKNPATGTIRHLYGTGVINPDTGFTDNGVHASDSPEAFSHEYAVIFTPTKREYPSSAT